MGLGNFRISWWSKAQTVVGAALEFVAKVFGRAADRAERRSAKPTRTGRIGEIVDYGGRPHRIGRCEPGSTCFACERLGSHLEPIDDQHGKERDA